MQKLLLIILFILFSFCISVTPNWNLKESSEDLLLSSTSHSYFFPDRVIEASRRYYTLKMKREIQKTEDNITYTNLVNVDGDFKIVPFDIVESFYKLNNYYICPNGKHHLYYQYKEKFYIPKDFKEPENWNLKCFKLASGPQLLVSYLTAKGDNFFFFQYLVFT